ISIAFFGPKVNISKYIYYIYFMRLRQMRGAHGRRYAPEAPQRKARGLKKHYGFSRNNPPSC
ncbi:hypothetical protein Q2348_25455, partial [Klebsiella pneumoniae]|uniref:hypothetical protein n=1 Tax=Klebsiella pneumoniae TaxID=573 RepID=UPI00266518BD